MKENIIVATIAEGVINEAKLFTSVELAEKCFTDICKEHLANESDMADHLDDGYFMWANGSVCLVHPEIVKKAEDI